MVKIEKLIEQTVEEIKKDAQNVPPKPKQLRHRVTSTPKPITKDQDRVSPAPDALSHENYLVAVREAVETPYPEYNFVFKNGNSTEYKALQKLTEVRVQPVGVPVKRIVIHHRDSDGFLGGFELYAQDGTNLYKTVWGWGSQVFTSQETILQEGERITGIKGRKNSDTFAHYHDFQFVIGMME